MTAFFICISCVLLLFMVIIYKLFSYDIERIEKALFNADIFFNSRISQLEEKYGDHLLYYHYPVECEFRLACSKDNRLCDSACFNSLPKYLKETK